MSSLNAHQQRQLAALALVLSGLLLSSAGLVIRQLEQADGYDVTFWRSVGCVTLVAIVLFVRSGAGWIGQTFRGGWVMLASGCCWAVMFTCFSVALSLTTVAKALVLIALSPLIAALTAWLFLSEQIPARTWLAILIAGAGVGWMISDGLGADPDLPLSNWGMLIAAGVPIGFALNFVLLKRHQHRIDLLPAVALGAVISCAVMLPVVFPVQATPSDIAWMLGLGVFQIGIPCSIIVLTAKYLAPQEAALLLLLEVVCGPLWVWLGVGEEPSSATLWGGALVVSALVVNEWLSIRQTARTT
ncbi:MAG: DMT family transporter [Burkholderiaceae bacterium]